jgi:hypothetical protein
VQLAVYFYTVFPVFCVCVFCSYLFCTSTSQAQAHSHQFDFENIDTQKKKSIFTQHFNYILSTTTKNKHAQNLRFPPIHNYNLYNCIPSSFTFLCEKKKKKIKTAFVFQSFFVLIFFLLFFCLSFLVVFWGQDFSSLPLSS